MQYHLTSTYTYVLATMSSVATRITVPVSFFNLPTMNIPMLKSAQAAYAPPRMSRNPVSQAARINFQNDHQTHKNCKTVMKSALIMRCTKSIVTGLSVCHMLSCFRLHIQSHTKKDNEDRENGQDMNWKHFKHTSFLQHITIFACMKNQFDFDSTRILLVKVVKYCSVNL